MSLFFRQDSSKKEKEKEGRPVQVLDSPNEVFLDDLQSVIAMVLSLIIVSLLSLSFYSCAIWTMDDEMDDMSLSLFESQPTSGMRIS
jgi:hypothetical protein